ncbi:putative dolichol-phosphate mannosyltransferase [Nostoc sp. NIES-4103]|nr:putative dolichol-phosphate mannosyltransferase [Nostoc sp. NIES-4103]
MSQCLNLDKLIKRLNQLKFNSIDISRLSRFLVVGFGGVFVDLGMFYLLHTSWNLDLTASSMLSTEIAIINNFYWNDVWTFADISQQQQLIHQRLQRFLKFNLIYLVGLLLNSLTVNLLFYQFSINEYIAKLVAIICMTIWNFYLNATKNWQIIENDSEVSSQ